MPDITFTGIGSGFQVSEVVSAIVGAERAPFTSRLNKQEALMTTDISAIGALKSSLEQVAESIKLLSDPDEYHKHNTTGSNSFVGISTNTNAEIGNYTVEVNALATSHKLKSAAIDNAEAVGEGTLTINSAANSFDISVSDTATLSEISELINNSTDNDSVIATIVNDGDDQHLILTSKETGIANGITTSVVDVSDGNNTDNLGLSRLAYEPLSAVNNLIEVNEALDAQITLDGSIVINSTTNTFTDVIEGVNITAKKIHGVDDDIANVSVVEDNSNVTNGLSQFVKSYNELLALSNTLGKSGEDGAGALAGDSLLRGVMSKLRQELSTSFSAGSGQLSLIELGVESDRYGVLSLDTEVLNDYVADNIDDVEQFFIGSEATPGFAASVKQLTEFYTDSDGIIQGRIDSKEKQLSSLDDDRLAFESKMESLEARLFAQYNAMDLIVANLNATSSYLMAQLDNMLGVVKKDN
jgi:flagellar hook-associated protein 2